MSALPLAGVRVVEFTHVVMGPVAGLILASLGAEVIRIEPPSGDPTRRLKGFAGGFNAFYNRNKKSVIADLKNESDRDQVYKLLATADVLIENFGPGTLARLGFGYDHLCKQFPRLVYCSLKGFRKGAYAHRIGMDEIVQMMGGLAYMTGREGDPLRAGTSILDITGGLFAVIGIQAALFDRVHTGQGTEVKASLFETSAFVLGQFFACLSAKQPTIRPMPHRAVSWPIYQLFKSQEGEAFFLGIISPRHWEQLCAAFNWADLRAHKNYQTETARLVHKEDLVAEIEQRFRALSFEHIIEKCEANNLPFAEINSPMDLLENEHLRGGGHLVKTEMPEGHSQYLPRIPIDIGNEEFQRSETAPQLGSTTIDELLKAKPQG